MIEVLYFARFRELLETSSEQLELSSDLQNLGDLAAKLSQRGGVWAEALGAGRSLMMARNEEMAGPETPLSDGDRVAFFPPVTGG